MPEARLFFGRFIESLQERYIRNKEKMGLITEDSSSEYVLSPLRREGIRGLSQAFKQAEILFGQELEKELGASIEDGDKRMAAVIGVVIGGLEFLLIAGGIRVGGVDEEGHWQPFVDFVDRITLE